MTSNPSDPGSPAPENEPRNRPDESPSPPVVRGFNLSPARGESKPSRTVSSRGIDSVIIAQDTMIDETRLQGLTDPFTPVRPARPSARDLFRPDRPGDSETLKLFVTPQRLDELWTQIEALQEEVVQGVNADRANTDAYQQDLLFASSLLLQSSANYEEARQILYRIRADLKREQRVLTHIRTFRPRILLYYAICCLLTLLAFGLDPTFRSAMPESLPILKMALLPILFGVLGALFNGVMALHEHTTIRRDFEPLHMSWYIINPFTGGLLGLVVFIFFVVTGSTFTPNLATDRSLADAQAPLVIWLLAFVVGWQQNIMLGLLNRFLKTFLDTGRPSPRPAASPAAAPPPDNAAG